AAIYSTFLQRAADQIIHDVALQKLPVVFAIDRAGFVPGDGETHQGLFDISLLRAIPNISLLAPASCEELRLMLDWALRQDTPCAIRYPKALSPPASRSIAETPLETGRGVFMGTLALSEAETTDYSNTEKAGILVAFTGGLYPSVSRAARLLHEKGIKAGFYNLRFLKPIDEDYLASLLNRYETVIFAEEGVKSGGFGEYAAELALRKNCSAAVFTLNAGERHFAQGGRDELLARCGLDGEGIAARVREIVEMKNKRGQTVQAVSQTA
ncbi:MAG: 1-deoxy-D-xylulose-5-phosphate synthase, partial [Spirochaetaceae bacterium]|nr:1-deoxy-D-xylulose-5-phosphate synthase [Spirochaetaceae bacterium]